MTEKWILDRLELDVTPDVENVCSYYERYSIIDILYSFFYSDANIYWHIYIYVYISVSVCVRAISTIFEP